MPLRFKIDEDLPREVAECFRTAGFDAQTVIEESLGGASDELLWEHAQREQRCLVTADKGIADKRKHPPGTHPGIILLRLPRESRAGYVRLADSMLAGA